MKKVQIRQGVFETNSSSTHSITICSKEDLVLLRKGTHTNKDLQKDWDDKDSDYLESYVEEYTTPKEEKIIIFGNYGRDR